MTSGDYSKVIIRDLDVDMLIGIYDHEKQNKQKVLINVEASIKHVDSWQGDNYDDVLCYETIVNKIKDMAASGHIHLVESFAHKIADYCLGDDKTQHVTVRVEKPDIIAETKSVGFEVRKSK